jgi:hypothetical protein
MPGVNRQGQAHIVSTAIPLPRSGKAGREVEATPWFRTWFSIDPQPASISPTINISIVFICAFLVDCGRIICHSAIKNDSGAILMTRRTFLNWFPDDSWDVRLSLVVCLVKDHVSQFAFVHKLTAC